MKIAIAALLALLFSAGCQQQYYRVTDVQTGKEFYAQSDIGGIFPTRSGTASFTDLATGDRVYLHSFRVAKIAPTDIPASAKSK